MPVDFAFAGGVGRAMSVTLNVPPTTENPDSWGEESGSFRFKMCIQNIF
jgi:hypothetical protein